MCANSCLVALDVRADICSLPLLLRPLPALAQQMSHHARFCLCWASAGPNQHTASAAWRLSPPPADPMMMPRLRVDKGAIKFVFQGANIMCPGLTSKGATLHDEVPEDTAVVSRGQQKLPDATRLQPRAYA